MRFSPSGRRLAYVAGQGAHPARPTITIVDRGVSVAVAPGHDPCWLNEDTLLWRDHSTGQVQSAQAPSWAIVGLHVLANELTAASSVWAWSLTDQGQPPYVQISTGAQFKSAFEPSLSDDGKWLAFRDHTHGSLAVHRFSDGWTDTLGPGTRPRWHGTTVCWEWLGKVYGRTTPQQATDELTVPGYGCSFPVPLYIPSVGIFVAMVLSLDDAPVSEIAVGEWVSLKAKQPKGWRVGQSGGSAFDLDVAM